MSKRWTKTCKEQQILEEKFVSGEINANNRPCDVYNRFPEFQKFTLDKFRSALNRTKTDRSLHLRKKSKTSGKFLLY